MNHEEVTKRFAARQINKRSGDVEWSGNNVYCRGNVIYSYGSHFPMAIYIGDGPFQFVRNADKYSVSTSRHQGIVSHLCKGPELPRHALSAVGIPFADITHKNILFWREGSSKFVFRNTRTNSFFEDMEYLSSHDTVDIYAKPNKSDEWEPPIYGQFRRSRKLVGVENKPDPNVELYETGWFTVDQVVVLSWKRKYYLVVKDKVSKLPRKPASLSAALEMAAESKTKSMFSQLGSKVLEALK